MLLMLLEIISYSYYCYFINSSNQEMYCIDTGSTSMIPVFVTVLLIPINNKHQHATAQHFQQICVSA
jgi:hypothetical protein